MEMNIGETDADGWTYVRFGDAAKAFQDGGHEVEVRVDAVREWGPCVGVFYDCWQYRMREKARTITVTIPRPNSATWDTSRDEEPYVKLYFKAGTPVWDICLALNNAIREQS
jgi:hypothetical protein